MSISARQSVARLMLPVLVTLSFGMMLLGKADAVIVERLRAGFDDLLAPAYAVIAPPLQAMRQAGTDLTEFWHLRIENEHLRDENDKLRRWQAVALALDAENATLKANLHWLPDQAPSYVTAHVVADGGGTYARAVLLAAGAESGLVRGEIALDAGGLAGRVTELGQRSARVLLITDINSRIPVLLEASRSHAMLVGTNGDRPRLMFWPDGTQPAEGDRVVTGAEAKMFPAGLPVGIVHLTASGPEVVPFAQLDRLEMLRIFDYGLHGIVPPNRRR